MWRFILLLFLWCEVCHGAKILLVFPIPAGSHSILGEGYVRNLVKAGHEVTYITPYPGKTTAPNLRRIVVSNTVQGIDEKFLNIVALMTKEVEMDHHLIFKTMYNISRLMLEHQDVQKLMNDPQEHFDVVIAERMFNDLYSGFSAVFNCPYIWSLSYDPNYETLMLIDEATNPAYTTNVAFSYVPPFTFVQRVEMLWVQIVSSVTSNFYFRNIEVALYEKAFQEAVVKKGRTLPPYDAIRFNASMMLGNTHVSFGTNIRLPQNFKSIGGYHVDPDVEQLPAELKNIMDNSKHGVIYFSMGSNLKSKDFPDDIKTGLLEMFGSLEQTVLWKFEESFSSLPRNVHIIKWAPQPSILAHPNCILFVTHGGLLSTTEAIHFGVPIIGIPIFFDQFNNIDRSVQKGIAKKILFSYNLAKELKVAIEEMTAGLQYKQRAKELSFIYHYRPISPGEELVYWVDYVIATKGAVHLRSPALDIPMYQKMYLDLLAVIALGALAVTKFITFLMFTSKRNGKSKEKSS